MTAASRRPGAYVWKLDRLSRCVKDVLIIADDLYEQGIGLRILTGTHSRCGEGKFFFTMMAAFAVPVGPPRSAR